MRAGFDKRLAVKRHPSGNQPLERTGQVTPSVFSIT
jgi:hypothetical protein